MPFEYEILREAMMHQSSFTNITGYGLGISYNHRRTPTLVCPCCKRAVMDLVATKDGKPFSIYRCKEHGDVVAIWSEVVNEY